MKSARPHRWLLVGAAACLTTAAATAFHVVTRDDHRSLPDGSLGMHVGFNRGDRFAQIERELGRQLDLVVTILDSGSASAMRSSAWGQFARADAYLPKLSDRVDVNVTVPLAFGGGGQTEAEIRENLRETAAGRWDGDYRTVARHVEDAGFGHAVIRLGHEHDHHYPSWSSVNNTAEYIAAFRHVHDVLASESPGFRFDWTSTRAGFRTWGPPAYPGDTYVDVIGLDAYWRGSTEISNRQWALYKSVFEAHRDFARARNKPVSYPEWGRAVADTGRYVELMHEWFTSLPASGGGRLLYQAYFNPTRSTYDLDDLPNVKRTYLDNFGVAAAPARSESD